MKLYGIGNTPLLPTFMIRLITCTTCGSLEIFIAFEEIPQELQVHWSTINNNALFLYYAHCDVWDIAKAGEKQD